MASSSTVITNPCEWCRDAGIDFPVPSVTRVPDLLQWACQAHAEDFWKRVVRAAGALSELRRAWDTADCPVDAQIVPGAFSAVELTAYCPACGSTTPRGPEWFTTHAECFLCSARQCPAGDPGHFESTGCPSCDYGHCPSAPESYGR